MTRERIPEFCYTKKDFRLDWYSGSGAGGQHRNKHQNCLRLTHIPSGITVTAAEGRDRPGNQRKAFERLRPKLEAWIRAQIGEKTYPRSDEVVRTYHEVTILHLTNPGAMPGSRAISSTEVTMIAPK